MSPASYNEGEGDRLRKAYEQADEHCAWVVREMARQRKTATDEDFTKLTQSFYEAQTQTATALRALKLFESERPKRRPTNI
jgi:hypothetical protein